MHEYHHTNLNSDATVPQLHNVNMVHGGRGTNGSPDFKSHRKEGESEWNQPPFSFDQFRRST